MLSTCPAPDAAGWCCFWPSVVPCLACRHLGLSQALWLDVALLPGSAQNPPLRYGTHRQQVQPSKYIFDEQDVITCRDPMAGSLVKGDAVEDLLQPQVFSGSLEEICHRAPAVFLNNGVLKPNGEDVLVIAHFHTQVYERLSDHDQSEWTSHRRLFTSSDICVA